jgi:hypothetical protein
MVCLRVMVVCAVVSRILETMREKSCGIWPFREVRTGVENSYQKTGAWFPLIGNNKHKLPYSEKVLFLAIHAAIRLHNFNMNSEQLSYSALESVDNLYTNYY